MKPIELEDSCSFSSVYTNFRGAARDMLAAGTPVPAVIGPDFVVVDLCFRDRKPTDPHTICSWASEVCKSFGEFDIFVLLAHVFFLSAYMRVSLAVIGFCVPVSNRASLVTNHTVDACTESRKLRPPSGTYTSYRPSASRSTHPRTAIGLSVSTSSASTSRNVTHVDTTQSLCSRRGPTLVSRLDHPVEVLHKLALLDLGSRRG